MYRKIDDFLFTFDTMKEGTTKMFARLTDANLDQSIAQGHRTLGQIAWHIVVTLPEMMNQVGLAVSTIPADSPPPTSASEIQAAYTKVSEELRKAISGNWSDDTLLQEDDLYGETWARGRTLEILLHHEIHHRGQMAVLLRQAGSKVPGNFGPSKEEWAQYGGKPPAY